MTKDDLLKIADTIHLVRGDDGIAEARVPPVPPPYTAPNIEAVRAFRQVFGTLKLTLETFVQRATESDLLCNWSGARLAQHGLIDASMNIFFDDLYGFKNVVLLDPYPIPDSVLERHTAATRRLLESIPIVIPRREPSPGTDWPPAPPNA